MVTDFAVYPIRARVRKLGDECGVNSSATASTLASSGSGSADHRVSPQVDEAVTLFARRLRYSSDPRSPRIELAAVFNERRQPSRITTAVRAQSGTFHGKIGLESDRFSEIRQSAIEVALIVPRNGAVVVGP